jgi:cell division ATPase FtsA
MALVMIAEPVSRYSLGRLEFRCRRRITREDAWHCAEVAVSVPGVEIARAYVLHWLVDGAQVDDPVGMEGERLEAYVRLVLEDA